MLAAGVAGADEQALGSSIGLSFGTSSEACQSRSPEKRALARARSWVTARPEALVTGPSMSAMARFGI
jgi:hypothetical protein